MAEADTAYLQQIRFVGRTSGLVKTLSGFKKGQHTVPDAINATTSAFLARLSATELAEEAEAHFQRARSELSYKRKDLSLDLSPPQAILTAKDFTWELTYAFSENDPASYVKTRALSALKNASVAARPEFASLFAAQFTDLVFVLTRGAPIEPVIDAVEALDESNALHVDYPSDASTCTLSVPDVEAQVTFNGQELALICPRAGAPGELITQFLTVRAAFRLTQDPVLSGLLG